MSHSLTAAFAGSGFTTMQTALFVACTVIAANLGLLHFHRFCRISKGEKNNSVTGILFGAVSVFYSLIQALVIVAEWDDYNDLDTTIASESDLLKSILSHSSNLPDALKATIRDAFITYCNQVVTQEWAAQKSMSSSTPVLFLHFVICCSPLIRPTT